MFGLKSQVAAAFSLALAGTQVACAEQTDFNKVGRQMAIMLQNSHFDRANQSFKELSDDFLATYLRDLDYGRIYFTQKDVDRFQSEYGERLASMLLEEDSMDAANDIYQIFVERVEARVAQANELLSGDEFDFTQPETIMRTRKDAAWPKDEKEAEDLFRKQIKESLLSEKLRREMLMKLAKEQSKEDLFKDERSPEDKIKLRYERFLHSVKDVDSDDVATYFLSAVAKTFDPHTDYLSFKQMERFRDDMRNQLVGIGALLQAEEDGATKIMGIVVNGPADRAGELRLNDRVVGVDPTNSGRPEDMVDIMFMKIDKVVDLIRGNEGSEVRLKVEPAGGVPGETQMIVIQRGKVELKDEQATAEVIDVAGKEEEKQRIGFITLPSFYADFDAGDTRCSTDVEVLLQRLIDEKIDGLVLDLRNNGGGSLEEVRRMTGFFTNRLPVVQVKNTLGQVQVKESDNRRPMYSGPMVVLVDKSSASASEILAGALQDDNRAVIVGESSTFGKGTVQQPMDIGRHMPLFAESRRAGTLKVTIQKFYRPSGSSTQNQGVIPDVLLPSLMDALEIGEKYLDHALDHDVIRPAPGFDPMPKANLFVPRLQELSEKRVEASKDFSYILEDVAREKKRREGNDVSLVLATRQAELADADKLQKGRNAERRERFATMEEGDKKQFTFYKLTLDDANEEQALKLFDPTEEASGNMRRAKDKTEELDTTPEWPSGLDPFKREALSVLGDLIDVTRDAKMAGMLKSSNLR
ncbi:carboxyl-terminal processing protease [Haloferula luteola]|uniref:Carboxyl-terminal processing protease n=1 Tax=Haloferula luteola TaxID=595692 RepID=A0A840V997_9BACT|nr:carboxy terminal-processing peptidase [Haloferula luteola]MBB5350359.1 carboxyl-terminal processing protease [Haloferula luteola]